MSHQPTNGENSSSGSRYTWLQQNFPLGILHPHKPRHFREILSVITRNAGQWNDAWRVLNGPCNGCAVQTDGLRDNVMPGVMSPHFCVIRLGLIEEVLRRPFDARRVANLKRLQRRSNAEIEKMGRIPAPLLRRHGEAGFTPISYEHAYELAAEWIAAHRGDASGFFTTSKGVNNEEYFAFQQFARTVGQTNNVDSCARQCHAASVAALKSMVGIGASSGSLSDFREADLLVLAGTNLANNQPLVMRYIADGREKRGGLPRVIVINSYLEPGLEKYWVPSSPRSALFGTQIADRFVHVRVGGDVALFNGIFKALIEESMLTPKHEQWIAARTTGFDAVRRTLALQTYDDLEARSGVSRRVMVELAREMARTDNIVFCWGMGLTQHHHGTDNVMAFTNLALALGQLGKARAGVAPLRGQSSVQAAGECGVAGTIFPGGDAVTAEAAAALANVWGAGVPDQPGLPTPHMIEAVHDGRIKCLVSIGGNLVDTLPGREFVRESLRRLPYRIRFDVMLNREALIEPGEASLIFPIRNWYEWESVFTTTSTDRTIRAFGGSIRPRVTGTPECWTALREIAGRINGWSGDGADRRAVGLSYNNTDEIRAAMDRDIWMYRGISRLNKPHTQLQWGGAYLFDDGFDRMPDDRAVFANVEPSNAAIPDGHVRVSTRRGFGQWNSQHKTHVRKDSFTSGRSRRDVLIHPQDAKRLQIGDGDSVALLTSDRRFDGICRIDAAQLPQHVQLFWPAANDLIPRGVYDRPTCEPDYNVFAQLVRGDTIGAGAVSSAHRCAAESADATNGSSAHA